MTPKPADPIARANEYTNKVASELAVALALVEKGLSSTQEDSVVAILKAQITKLEALGKDVNDPFPVKIFPNP